MERVVQVLVKAVVNMTKKVVSGSMIVFSMAEEVVKRLVVIRPEVLLLGVLKCFTIGGSGRIPSVIIFILEIIINLAVEEGLIRRDDGTS